MPGGDQDGGHGLLLKQTGQILAFKHSCSSQQRIFCFQLPKECPICGELMLKRADHGDDQLEAISIEEIELLPSPLKKASKSSCSLAIRPSQGNFLSDYKNSSLLHICVTTSDGRVVEFDEAGARITAVKDEALWQSCLTIRMLDHQPVATGQLWDQKLVEMIGQERWTANAYDAVDNNCFDFVLDFLRSLDVDCFKSSITSKTRFCEEYIVPKTRLLARYISLYRKIQADTCVILRVSS